MKTATLVAPSTTTLRHAYERGLRYHAHLQATGRPWRCDQCRTCLREAVRLLALSQIDPSFRIADALAREYRISREQMREDCHFAAAVDTIAVYCGDDAREFVLQGQKNLDRKTVMQISRTAPSRQRYEMERVRAGQRPLTTNGNGCPVYDTVDFREILSRLRRAQGKLAVSLLGVQRLTPATRHADAAPAVRERLAEIRADTRLLLRGVQSATEGVPCPCDLVKVTKSGKKSDSEPVVPANLKGVLGMLNQARSWTRKCAGDLPELLREVLPIRREKEEIRQRRRAIIQTADAILGVLPGE